MANANTKTGNTNKPAKADKTDSAAQSEQSTQPELDIYAESAIDDPKFEADCARDWAIPHAISSGNTITLPARLPSVSAEVAGQSLTISFADGRNLVLDAMQTTAGIRDAAMMHGFKQKLLDAAAIARNTLTGASVSIADKFNAVEEVYLRLTREIEPAWNKGRTEGAGQTGGILKRALMQLGGKSAVEVDTFLANKSKAEQAALRKNGRVAAIILELQTAGADDAIDSDEMLGELIG